MVLAVLSCTDKDIWKILTSKTRKMAKIPIVENKFGKKKLYIIMNKKDIWKIFMSRKRKMAKIPVVENEFGKQKLCIVMYKKDIWKIPMSRKRNWHTSLLQKKTLTNIW